MVVDAKYGDFMVAQTSKDLFSFVVPLLLYHWPILQLAEIILVIAYRLILICNSNGRIFQKNPMNKSNPT
jgi:hypothetical protein